REVRWPAGRRAEGGRQPEWGRLLKVGTLAAGHDDHLAGGKGGVNRGAEVIEVDDRLSVRVVDAGQGAGRIPIPGDNCDAVDRRDHDLVPRTDILVGVLEGREVRPPDVVDRDPVAVGDVLEALALLDLVGQGRVRLRRGRGYGDWLAD